MFFGRVLLNRKSNSPLFPRAGGGGECVVTKVEVCSKIEAILHPTPTHVPPKSLGGPHIRKTYDDLIIISIF